MYLPLKNSKKFLCIVSVVRKIHRKNMLTYLCRKGIKLYGEDQTIMHYLGKYRLYLEDVLKFFRKPHQGQIDSIAWFVLLFSNDAELRFANLPVHTNSSICESLGSWGVTGDKRRGDGKVLASFESPRCRPVRPSLLSRSVLVTPS